MVKKFKNLVLIVAKCIVNFNIVLLLLEPKTVLIVAKCIVNNLWRL